jgi:hypothetical protein
MPDTRKFDLREWLAPSVLMSMLFGLPLAAAHLAPVAVGLHRSDAARRLILSGTRNGQ